MKIAVFAPSGTEAEIPGIALPAQTERLICAGTGSLFTAFREIAEKRSIPVSELLPDDHEEKGAWFTHKKRILEQLSEQDRVILFFDGHSFDEHCVLRMCWVRKIPVLIQWLKK